MSTHRTMNYIRTDCPICGCKNTRCVWQDEDGQSYYECDICEDCENGEDLANKLQIREYVKELMRNGITKESELIEVVAETLYAESRFISMGNARRVARWMIPKILERCLQELAEEDEEAREEFKAYAEAIRGNY